MNNVTISEFKSMWARILDRVHEYINDDQIFNTFFLDSSIYKIESDKLTVLVNSKFARSIVETNYKECVLKAISEITETNLGLEIVIAEDIQNTATVKNEPIKPVFFQNSELNPKYTFESFVVGPSNRETYQAALMIASNPGKFYNPLFIYSDSGLGKTHLLHAIGNDLRIKQPRAKVLYISADAFVDEYIRYVRGEKESDNLKDYFKTIDVLLVDDIQFLAGKDKTQEMFFFIFNALVNNNKQIVLTSDRHPNELKGLEERLVTRFNQGLNTNISKPDSSTLLEILKKKIVSSGMDITRFDEDVLVFFANKFSSNVRELEGALNRLVFYTINIKQANHINMSLALESVSALIKTKDIYQKLDEHKIISTVADYYNLPASQITGKMRTSEISMARHIAIYLCRVILDMPFTKIGEVFGGKDHSTIMSAVKKVENQLKTNEQLKEAIKELRKRLK